jgi:hypothetical protein
MKTWKKTRLQNLVRHKSGRYYARAFNNNKEIWVPVCAKQLTLPSRDQFCTWSKRSNLEAPGVREMRGLAFTGCRTGEAGHVEWRDVDFDSGEIVVRMPRQIFS